MVTLTLPYEAFKLQLSYPFPNVDSGKASSRLNYFPLRRAADSTLFILGHAFLQEVYLAVDYERHQFYLSQASFQADATTNVRLLSITRPENILWPGPSITNQTGLSIGGKAGIGIGGALGAMLGIFVLVRMTRRRTVKDEPNESPPPVETRFSSTDSKSSVSELIGDNNYPAEVLSDSTVTRFELPATSPIEMPADEVPSTFFEKEVGSTIRHSRTSNNSAEESVELEC